MMRFIQETEEEEQTDTEITLGMKSLLGVFFGLVLICGVFFGLGYSLGRGGSKPVPNPASEQATKTTPKLAPSTVVSSSNEDDTTTRTAYTPGPDAQEPDSATISTSPAPRKPSASVMKPVQPSATADTSSPAPKPAPAVTSPPAIAPPASATAPTAATPTGSPAMVQIAAISKQEDADVLVAALKRHGYGAVVRNDPKDNLLHVQIGPFATREEARAMRAKLLADGYNAILK